MNHLIYWDRHGGLPIHPFLAHGGQDSTPVAYTHELDGWCEIVLPQLQALEQKAAHAEKDEPPINAEFLFHLFMTAQSADAIVGDLGEKYKRHLRKYGCGRARFWYCVQTFISLKPIIWAWIKKPLTTLATMAAAKGLIGHDGWIAAAIEFVKRLRP